VDDAVGIVAHEVGLYLVGGYNLRFMFRGAFGHVDVIGDFAQVFGCENGHDWFLLR